MLKGLVAVACLVVIAGGGYLGWKEFAGVQAASAASDFAAGRQRCLLVLDQAATGKLARDAIGLLLSPCVAAGHLDMAELEAKTLDGFVTPRS